MDTIIKKWGNSLALRIPQVFTNALKIDDGSSVNIEIEGDKLIISKNKRLTLDQLLSQVTPENIHKDINFGRSVGREEW